MNSRSFLYLAREGIVTALRYPGLALATTASISASLLVLAITLLTTANIERQATDIESRRVVDVYIKEDIKTGARLELERALENLAGVVEATYVSKEEALEAFHRDIGRQDLVDALGFNPLPASFRLELAEGARSGTRMRAIAERVKSLPGVDDARYGGEWVERLDATLLALRLVELIAAVLAGLSAAFAVGSTIRLTFFARREMIEIMKAVGATDSFIRTPFLVEGIAHSVVAAIATLVVLRLVIGALGPHVGEIKFLGPSQLLGFLAFAVALGFVGAAASVRAALRRTS